MIGRILKSLLEGGWEVLFSIALVLGLSLGLMGAIVMMFPKGTGLVNFYEEMVVGGGPRATRQAGLGGISGAAAPAQVAVLASVSNLVKERAADAIAWDSARRGLAIGDRHAVQTLDRSTATIRIDSTHDLHLGENSLVVFRREEPKRRRDPRRASLVLMNGRVRGQLAAGEADPIDIVTAGATGQMQPSPRGDGDFTVMVNPDKSSTFSVYSGTASITTEGKTVTLGAKQTVSVAPDGTAGVVLAIPEPPLLLAPAEGHSVIFSTISPRLDFVWSSKGSPDAWRLELAADRGFDRMVYKRTLESNRFTYGDLQSGDYYWRVTAVRGGAESEPSAPRRLSVVRDGEGPPLTVRLPEELNGTDRLVVTGTTEPGARVFVGEAGLVADAGGRFRSEIVLERGMNVVVVEAVDEAGNSSFHSAYVNAKF